MRVCPCWGVEYVLIVQSMSHMPGLPIQTEGLKSSRRSIYIEASHDVFTLGVVFFFFFGFLLSASFNRLPFKWADGLTSVSRRINLTKFFLYVFRFLVFTKTTFDCLERSNHPYEGVATRVSGDKCQTKPQTFFFFLLCRDLTNCLVIFTNSTSKWMSLKTRGCVQTSQVSRRNSEPSPTQHSPPLPPPPPFEHDLEDVTVTHCNPATRRMATWENLLLPKSFAYTIW